jgi:hypothetical protein
MAIMSFYVGVTDDLERVSIALMKDGKRLGWLEFDGPQCESFVRAVEKYRRLLKPPATVGSASESPHDDTAAERREPIAEPSADEIRRAEAISRKQGLTTH